MLIFKRTYECRSIGPWSYEDYNVFDGNQCVGRVLYNLQGPEGRPWFWSINASETQNGQDCGYAASRELAEVEFERRLDA